MRQLPPLILVSQIQRSGGTLMPRVFDGHPEVLAYPHELQWGIPNKYFWPSLPLNVDFDRDWVFDSLIGGARSIFEDLSLNGYQKASTAGYLTSYPFNWSYKQHKELFNDWLNDHQPNTQRDVLDCFLHSFFQVWMGEPAIARPIEELVEGKKFVIAFTPRVGMIEDIFLRGNIRFFEDYPDGYLMSLIRNPSSWLASAQNHLPHEYADPHEALELWSISCRSTLQLIDNFPRSVIPLVLDDFISDPTEWTKRIEELLGLASFDWVKEPSYMGQPIESDSSFEVAFGFDQRIKDRADKLISDNSGAVDFTTPNQLFHAVKERIDTFWNSVEACR